MTKALINFVTDFIPQPSDEVAKQALIVNRQQMKYLSLPHDFLPAQSPALPFFLAMEEYAARLVGDEDLFFMWQVDPTVIVGRNQLIHNEVNMTYCLANDIRVYRRKSGGGCVYADPGNIMFSYITRSDDVTTVFSDYTSAVAEMLCGLGLNAEATGRNDILIDGRKVSGNAFYHKPGRSIVHGTMLFTADVERMLRAITPSAEKLESKGVTSVRSRITSISEHITMGINEFKDYVRRMLCSGEVVLTEPDVAEIVGIEAAYLSREFIEGKNPHATFEKAQRIEGVGELRLSAEVKGGRFGKMALAGDFFVLGDVDGLLLAPLEGVECRRETVETALAGVDVRQVIMNLTNNQFINLVLP